MKISFVKIALLLLVSIRFCNSFMTYHVPLDTFELWEFSEDCKYYKNKNKVDSYITDSISIYTSSKSKMYIYRDHFLGFLCDWGNIFECKKIYKEKNNILKLLSENGFLSGKMLLTEEYKPFKYINENGDTSISIPSKRSDSIKILNVVDVTDSLITSNKHFYKMFEIWATDNFNEDGWGGFSVFYLLLENYTNRKSVNLRDFIKDAEIKCFYYSHMQI